MMRLRAATLFLSIIGLVSAQVGPIATTNITLAGTSTQVAAIPAGSSSVAVNLIVDATPSGGDVIDVNVGDPSVVISLTSPTGNAINTANAASLGFAFSTGVAGTSETFSPFEAPGTHTFIQFPAGQPSGTYVVNANASATAADTAMTIQYYSSSAVQMGAASDATTYRLGDQVIVSGFLYIGSIPITGATVSATATVNLPVQATVANYQLVSQQAVSPGYTLYTYGVSLNNPGPALTNVTAQVSSSDPAAYMEDAIVVFDTVPAGGSATGLKTFSIQLPNTETFDPSSLSWQISTPGTPLTFTLTDSGTYDAATGDGIYTGVFTPTITGNYTLFLTGTGVSTSNVPFSRTTITSFDVSPVLAQLGSFSDAPAIGSTGLQDTLAITAAVNVQAAGTYSLALDLTASNGKNASAFAIAQLAAGSQQVTLNFPYANLLALGVDGPYTEAHARLALMGSPENTLADYGDGVGQTQPYKLSSMSQSVLAFSGSNSALGVVTGSGPTFDLLQIDIGVNSPSASTCDWSAELTDLSGNELSFASVGGNLQAGNNVVTLTFDGNLLAESANGPYLVKNAAVRCGAIGQIYSSTLFQTPNFTASQFTYVAPTFSISAQAMQTSTVAGTSASFRVVATNAGAFHAPIALSVGGLPSGATGSFSAPIVGFGTSFLNVTSSSTTPPGTNTLTISGSGGGITQSAPVSLVITQPALTAQTITFSAIPAQAAGATLALSATATSGLTVTFSSSTPSVCTVSGSSVNFVTAGTCSITASQPGNSTYAAATPVSQSFSVLSSQTITFGAVPAQAVGIPLTLTASSSSGLSIIYNSSTQANCTISGYTVTFLVSGSCSITASQPGNTTYAAPSSVTQSFPVNQ